MLSLVDFLRDLRIGWPQGCIKLQPLRGHRPSGRVTGQRKGTRTLHVSRMWNRSRPRATKRCIVLMPPFPERRSRPGEPRHPPNDAHALSTNALLRGFCVPERPQAKKCREFIQGDHAQLNPGNTTYDEVNILDMQPFSDTVEKLGQQFPVQRASPGPAAFTYASQTCGVSWRSFPENVQNVLGSMTSMPSSVMSSMMAVLFFQGGWPQVTNSRRTSAGKRRGYLFRSIVAPSACDGRNRRNGTVWASPLVPGSGGRLPENFPMSFSAQPSFGRRATTKCQFRRPQLWQFWRPTLSRETTSPRNHRVGTVPCVTSRFKPHKSIRRWEV